MNRHQRMESPQAGRVNGPHDKFFARAALPGDQHIGVRRTHRLDRVYNLAHRGALADHVVRAGCFGNCFPQPHILFFRLPVRQRLLHQMRNFVRIQRLADVIVGPILQCRDRGFD